MKFLIMTRVPQIYSSRRLVQEITARGHETLLLNPETPWGEPVEVVIPRLGNFRYDEALQNFRAMEQAFPAVRVLNPSVVFHQARHKKSAHQALGSLPQPMLVEEVNAFPVIVKDCVSSQGEGVFLCRSGKELQEVVAKLQGREILFQEYIAESSGHDVRVFVIGTRIIAAIQRTAKDPSRDFRANLSLGGIASEVLLTTEEESLCLHAVQRLKLDYAGVDFVRSRRGPLLLEVNPCPGLEGVEKCTGVNVAEEMVLYAESLFNSDS